MVKLFAIPHAVLPSCLSIESRRWCLAACSFLFVCLFFRPVSLFLRISRPGPDRTTWIRFGFTYPPCDNAESATRRTLPTFLTACSWAASFCSSVGFWSPMSFKPPMYWSLNSLCSYPFFFFQNRVRSEGVWKQPSWNQLFWKPPNIFNLILCRYSYLLADQIKTKTHNTDYP